LEEQVKIWALKAWTNRWLCLAAQRGPRRERVLNKKAKKA